MEKDEIALPAKAAAAQEKAKDLDEQDEQVDERQAIAISTVRPSTEVTFPRWLRINLIISKATVALMFAVACVDLAFADVMRSVSLSSKTCCLSGSTRDTC